MLNFLWTYSYSGPFIPKMLIKIYMSVWNRYVVVVVVHTNPEFQAPITKSYFEKYKKTNSKNLCYFQTVWYQAGLFRMANFKIWVRGANDQISVNVHRSGKFRVEERKGTFLNTSVNSASFPIFLYYLKDFWGRFRCGWQHDDYSIEPVVLHCPSLVRGYEGTVERECIASGKW